jgi:hypothetical protein
MKTTVIFICVILLIPIYGLAQHSVDFESVPLGSKFGGPPQTNFNGQVIFEENLLPFW